MHRKVDDDQRENLIHLPGEPACEGGSTRRLPSFVQRVTIQSNAAPKQERDRDSRGDCRITSRDGGGGCDWVALRGTVAPARGDDPGRTGSASIPAGARHGFRRYRTFVHGGPGAHRLWRRSGPVCEAFRPRPALVDSRRTGRCGARDAQSRTQVVDRLFTLPQRCLLGRERTGHAQLDHRGGRRRLANAQTIRASIGENHAFRPEGRTRRTGRGARGTLRGEGGIEGARLYHAWTF